MFKYMLLPPRNAFDGDENSAWVREVTDNVDRRISKYIGFDEIDISLRHLRPYET
jgi:hypothetical protein